jgi:hypothetical protein
MNLTSRLGFSASFVAAAALVGCIDESEEPPAYYAPENAPPHRRPPPPQPIPTTHLPYYEYQSAGDYGTPRPRSPYTIDLGYIGDWQFGSADAPSSGPPSWARPFPCNWEHSCGFVRGPSPPDFGYTRYGDPMASWR